MKEDWNFFLETKYNASIEVAFKEIFNTSHDCFNSSSTSSVLLLTVHSNNSRSKDRDGVFGIRNGMDFLRWCTFFSTAEEIFVNSRYLLANTPNNHVFI